MRHYILYIPGLGDGYDRYREKALKSWARFGVSSQVIPMTWYDGRTYDGKFRQASVIITQLLDQGAKVSLVGESAGASMAINLFAADPRISRLITIAGVTTPSTPVARRTLDKGPAFAVSRQNLGDSLAKLSDQRRQDIYTLSALSDNVVRMEHSTIPGAHSRTIWVAGHFFMIAFCITVYSWYIIYLIKKPAANQYR